MRKALLILGLGVLVLLILSIINIKSTFSHVVDNNAKININGGAGNINFTSNSNNQTVSGYFSHKFFSKINFVNNSNVLNTTSPKVNASINLPKDITFSEVTLNLGAGNLVLDLRTANIQKFSINSGSSNVKLTLPQDVSSKFDIAIGAGNLELVIPINGKIEGIKIISASLTNMNLSDIWVKTSDGIQTKDFQKAKITSTIDLSKSMSVNLDISSIE